MKMLSLGNQNDCDSTFPRGYFPCKSLEHPGEFTVHTWTRAKERWNRVISVVISHSCPVLRLQRIFAFVYTLKLSTLNVTKSASFDWTGESIKSYENTSSLSSY
ncbi:hypothetical protein V1478_001870 [Vespula squamosa]|uniref:Uncharacterized protein n=1 Tax=Vespula squamosa TaxID=30214 RepID=A0ABD2BYC9_VESSQ